MLLESEYDFAMAERRRKDSLHEQTQENPVLNVPDNDRQPQARLHLPGEAPGFPRVNAGSLYCLLPQCERCPATRGLRAVRVTVDLPNASGISEPCPTGPITMDGTCVDELRSRGFAVTTLASEELAPEITPEVPA